MDYLQFIDLSGLPLEAKKKILSMNKEIGARAIEVFEPTEDEPNSQLIINIDVDKCNHIDVEEKIKKILKDNNITYLISGAS